MEDPRAIVPYHDPYDDSNMDALFNFMDTQNDNSDDFSSMDQPFPNPSLIPQFNDDMDDADIPFDDPIMWDLFNESNEENSEAGPSETDRKPSISEENLQRSLSEEDMRQLLIWPPEPVPFGCACCQVLREIIHTDGGQNTTRLEIHGRLGIICHAILEIRGSVSSTSSRHDYQMFDFCKKSIEDVKQFLVQYCDERRKSGFMILEDPLSMFYEALCVGLYRYGSPNINDFFQVHTPPPAPGVFQVDPTVTENAYNTIPRTSLAEQRERTGKMTIRDIGSYFNLPIDVAAKKLKLCPTVVKKICRRGGLSRWPYRKIKSIERKLSQWTATLSSNNSGERERAQAEIHRLQQEMANVCAGVLSR